MKQFTKCQMKGTAKHHAGRIGYFQFFGCGTSEGTAVFSVEAKKSNPMTYFAVGVDDYIQTK